MIMINIIKLSLWNIGSAVADEHIYREMKRHALIALPANILSTIEMPTELRQKWKQDVLRQIRFNCNYIHMQNSLPITVPYVVLKGTSAAQYYPHPIFRAMGDIDIITKRDDFDCACRQLIDDGFSETTSIADMERGRHRSFVKNNYVVEMHAFFASMNDVNKAKFFDDLVINNVNDSHILPDMVNGLVIIEHINQHMEEGLGLRQIIDWMMFVDKCLSDEKWTEFNEYARKAGLKSLAIVVTRMCELYLGLSEHEWCSSADEGLCSELMSYILECGNFGTKVSPNQKLAVSRAIELKHPFQLLKELQTRGVSNWKAARNPVLRPFAWIWQGLQFSKNSREIIEQYGRANQLDAMFDALGVRRSKNGIVYYKDGEYYKK